MIFLAQNVGRLTAIWHRLSHDPDRAIARRGAQWLRAARLGLAALAAVACSASVQPSGVPPDGEAGAAGQSGGALGCDYNGNTYAVGESFKCDCNECMCNEGGRISSTDAACLPCLYGGKEVLSGTTFPDRDGCNSCSCEVATVSCTKTACSCDPAKEWWRKYVGTSAKECMVVDFSCDNGTKMFSNDCGCGCEEPNTCPQLATECDPTFDCVKVLADCPYATAP